MAEKISRLERKAQRRAAAGALRTEYFKNLTAGKEAIKRGERPPGTMTTGTMPSQEGNYWEGVERAVLQSADPNLVSSVRETRPEMFKTLLDLCLARAVDIMGINLDPADPNFAKLLASQRSIMGSVLSTSVRTDGDALRERKTDKADAMLTRARAAARKVVTAEVVPPPETASERALRELMDGV